MSVTSWNMTGAAGEVIHGDMHAPLAAGTAARGVVIISHGFKGYKDYGMFPAIAHGFAQAGFIAHRFNFSHSGMTNEAATFERPELFERDTWNKQVFDLRVVMKAVASGELAGAGVPLLLFGHSRGGVTTLLTVGRMEASADGGAEALPEPAGIITAAAPAACQRLSEDEIELFQTQGYIESPSSRTGQNLRVNRLWLDEQLADPATHDLLRLVRGITCPLLLIHGTDDPTVEHGDADALARAAGNRAGVVKIDGANHVFNTPNPFRADDTPGAALRELIESSVTFAASVADGTLSAQ